MPHEGSDIAGVEYTQGGARRSCPTAANACTILPEAFSFEWASVDMIKEALFIMKEGAKAAGLPVLGRTYDLTKWFRMSAVAKHEYWKCGTFFKGQIWTDVRLQMGRRSAAHAGHSLSILITAIAQRVAQEKCWRAAANNEELSGWIRKRLETGMTAAQAGPIWIAPFQDDFVVIVIGQKVADAFDAGFKDLLGELGVVLSEKPSASEPFAAKFRALGADVDASNLDRIVVLPRKEIGERLHNLARRRGPVLRTKTEYHEMAGLAHYLASFIPGGGGYATSCT